MRHLLLSAALLVPGLAAAESPTVFAAASLKTALDQVAQSWQDAGHDPVVISYAGSSALARQIEAGAPADLFLSASVAWMDTVEGAGVVVPGTRRDLLGNTLVLIGAEDGAVDLADLPATLGEQHLAMALVDSVPAGQYGKAALTYLGLWDALAPHVAQADNVRAALALVATGEAPFGVVYATDAAAEPRVHLAATFPAESHPPIIYPAAQLTTGTAPEDAVAFLAYLGGAEAAQIFQAQGFSMKGEK